MQITDLKRLGTNATILMFLSVVAVDALPSTCTAHQRMKNVLDPALDATGLWQESWRLFAPEPDSINIRVSARIFFDNGQEVHWNSPNYSNMGPWERFRTFRRMEYYDALRQDNNSVAWKPFAEYIARAFTNPAAKKRPIRVALSRHWVETPPPTRDAPLMPVGGDWTSYGSCEFYVWEAGS